MLLNCSVRTLVWDIQARALPAHAAVCRIPCLILCLKEGPNEEFTLVRPDRSEANKPVPLR